MGDRVQAQYGNRVFISYASEDRQAALQLYDDLKKAGFDPWMDTKDLTAGTRWEDEIGRVIRECSHVVLLLSSHAVSRKGFIQKEIRMIQDALDYVAPRDIFLIQARLEECWSDHEKLRSLHWVDMFPDWRQGLERIAQALGGAGRFTKKDFTIRSGAEEFYREVAEIYRLLGCDDVADFSDHPGCLLVSRRDAFSGDEVRMLVMPRKLDPDGDDGAVSESFVSRALGTLNRGVVSSAYLITDRSLSSESRKKGEYSGLFFKTRDELLDSLINFRRYFETFIRNMEQKDRYRLVDTYVRLNFSRLDSQKALDVLHGKQAAETRTAGLEGVGSGKTDHGAPDFEIDPETPLWVQEEIVIDDFVAAWLNREDAPGHLSILGDFGAGKTSFCKHFTYETIRKRLRAEPDVSSRIPLYIPLNRYARLEGSSSVEALLSDCLANDYGIPASYKAVKKLMEAGKLLLLLDGFDEMAQKVDPEVRKHNFRVLADLAQPPNKVILTGRPGYFPAFSEIVQTFSKQYPPEDGSGFLIEHLKEKISGKTRPNFDILKLELLSDRQLDDFLEKQKKRIKTEGVENLDKIKPFVRQREQLLDLFGRPVLVWMMVEALPKWIESGKSLSDLNLAVLYEMFTRTWQIREDDKGSIRRLKTPRERLKFSMDLAWELHVAGEKSISEPDLKQRVKRWFCLEKEIDAEYVAHDVRLCAFLSHDERDGYFRFIHNSFREYFVALRLEKALKSGRMPGTDIDCIPVPEGEKTGDREELAITEAIRSFVYDMLYKKWIPEPFRGDLPEGLIFGEGKIFGEIDGAEMVYVPPGPFIMGEGDRIRVVNVPFGFFMDRYPVTNEIYARFIENGGYERKEFWSQEGWRYKRRKNISASRYWNDDRFNAPDHPVVGISWHEAETFARWCGKSLPGEVMWEKAARGIDGRIYPWGDEKPNPSLCNYADKLGEAKGTSPAGKFEKGQSPYGLHDMAGNVWEWCSDIYGGSNRVYRGGGWNDSSGYSRCSYRVRNDPGYRHSFLGFRLARTL